MVGTVSACPNGHSKQWESQRCHHGMPWLNLLVSGAILFSGSNIAKSLGLFHHMKVEMISKSTFNRIQTAYVVPTATFTWNFHQQEHLNQFQGQVVTLGGDARCDSPGYSAWFLHTHGVGIRKDLRLPIGTGKITSVYAHYVIINVNFVV